MHPFAGLVTAGMGGMVAAAIGPRGLGDRDFPVQQLLDRFRCGFADDAIDRCLVFGIKQTCSLCCLPQQLGTGTLAQILRGDSFSRDMKGSAVDAGRDCFVAGFGNHGHRSLQAPGWRGC